MYENFLANSINSKTMKGVDITFPLEYKNYIPESLIALWEEIGIGIYCDGLFRVIVPSEYQDLVASCYTMEYDKFILPFMSTAFGDIFAYVENSKMGGYVVFLNIRYGTYKILSNNITLLLNKIIFNKSCLDTWFNLDNYTIVKEKIGIPDIEECYGYIPALAVGGNEDISNIEIVKALPYIDLNTQFIGEFRRADQ